MIDSGSDDEEERKKEQEAKMAGGTLGALVGIGAGIISALIQKDEPDEGTVWGRSSFCYFSLQTLIIVPLEMPVALSSALLEIPLS